MNVLLWGIFIPFLLQFFKLSFCLSFTNRTVDSFEIFHEGRLILGCDIFQGVTDLVDYTFLDLCIIYSSAGNFPFVPYFIMYCVKPGDWVDSIQWSTLPGFHLRNNTIGNFT